MGFLNKGEVWKPVNGFEGHYEVSNKGEVKSLARKDSIGRQVHETLLTRTVDNSTGYFKVNLSKNGIQITKNVHQLVAEAFCKKPKTKEPLHVHHKVKNNKLNNNANNLVWMLASEHTSMESKGRNQGVNNGRSILTEAQVREIKIRQQNYYYGQDSKLAREYGVSRHTIRLIRQGKLWGHVEI